MRRIVLHLWLILSLLTALIAGRMLLTSQHFYTHDDMQVFRVNEYVQCLRDGQIPCRWSANLGKGYGYPLFNFYPPVIYLIPSLLHLVGLPIITSLNLFMFASFLLAGWGMYLLGKALTHDSRLGFLASILYTLYPFHAINVFIRGVYAENLAWSLLPLIFYLIYQQSRHNRLSRTLPFVLAIVYLTHLIGAIIVTGLVIIWALYHQNLRRVLGQILLSLGLASFFLIPALVEKSLVQTESMISGYFAFTNHYVSSYQLFAQYKWSYDASLWSAAPDEMPYMVGHVHTALLMITGFILLFALFRNRSLWVRNSKQLLLALGLLLAAVFLLFLSHFKADFLWQVLPPLAYVQFPWRFIAWAALPLILAIVIALSLLPKKLSYMLTLLTSLILLFYSLPFFYPRAYDTLTDQDILVGRERIEQQTKSLYDYLPKSIKSLPPEIPIYPSSSTRTSFSYQDTLTLDRPSSVSFPIFYYPGWVAQVNGTQITLPSPPDSGLITLDLPEGKSEILLRFDNTPLRLFANYLSLFSLALASLYVILNTYGKKPQTA